MRHGILLPVGGLQKLRRSPECQKEAQNGPCALQGPWTCSLCDDAGKPFEEFGLFDRALNIAPVRLQSLDPSGSFDQTQRIQPGFPDL